MEARSGAALLPNPGILYNESAGEEPALPSPSRGRWALRLSAAAAVAVAGVMGVAVVTTVAMSSRKTASLARPRVEPVSFAKAVDDDSVGGDDKAIEAAGVSVRVKGQSGKMTITVPSGGSTMDVECQMVALRQLDASGNTLGGGGSEKHSFESFATQSFTFSEPTDTTYAGIKVSKIAFESTLVGSSKVEIDTLIFKEPGSMIVGNNNLSVQAGTVKFNVKLGTWSWCGGDVACKGGAGEGAAVELDISVEAMGEGNPKEVPGAKGQPESFVLGDFGMLTMLSTYSDDGGGTWTPMPSGYPKVDGAKFTLKFPRWEGTVMYDPIIQGSGAAALTTWAPLALAFASFAAASGA